MPKALVIGNGESRKYLNLDSYRSEYTLIGCNAIHRDLKVDHLVCCDRRMADEATKNQNTSDTLIYVRTDWFHYFRKIRKNKNIRLVPEIPYNGNIKADEPFHWGSGGYAVLLAATLDVDLIELVGFDLYPSRQCVNNIYKGTSNYSKADSKPVDYSYWIYQLSKIFACYPDKKFVIKNLPDWNMPAEWQKNNVSFVAL